MWRETLKGILADDFSAELARIEAPTLVIWGDDDTVLPREDQEALALLICRSQLIVYQGAGHVFYWEEPARVAADLVAFIEALTSRVVMRSQNKNNHGRKSKMSAEVS